jgi:hypothetical protein
VCSVFTTCWRGKRALLRGREVRRGRGVGRGRFEGEGDEPRLGGPCNGIEKVVNTGQDRPTQQVALSGAAKAAVSCGGGDEPWPHRVHRLQRLKPLEFC